MIEHIKEVLINTAQTKNFKLITEKLSFEEKGYFLDHIEEIFSDKNIGEKYNEADMMSIFTSLYTSSEAEELLKNEEKKPGTYSEENKLISCISLPNDELKMKYINLIKDQSTVIQSLSSDESKIKCLDKLNGDYEKLDIIQSLNSDKSKIECLDKLDSDDNKLSVIQNLSLDELKIECLDKLTEDYKKIDVIQSLSSDESKIECLDKMNSDYEKLEIIQNLNSDESKIQTLDKLDSDNNKLRAIQNLSSDELKVKYIDNMVADYEKFVVIQSLSSDKLKIECLDKLNSDDDKLKIIQNLSSDETKIECLDKLNSDDNKLRIIQDLSSDESKIKCLDKFTEDYKKLEIIQNLSSDESKIKCLDKMNSDDNKLRVIQNLSSDESKLRCLNNATSDEYKVRIIISFTNPLNIIETLNKIPDTYKNDIFTLKITEILKALSTDELRKKYIHSFPEEYRKEIILSFTNDEDKIKYLKEVSKEEYKTTIISSIKELRHFSNDAISLIASKNPNATLEEYIKSAIIAEKLINSNSLELSSFVSQFYDSIVQSKDPDIMSKKIEDIYLRNNIPMFGKLFLSFQVLYPEFEKYGTFDFSENSMMSPELLNPTQSKEMKVISRFTSNKEVLPNNIRFQILFNDLLRIASGSNNRSLLEYIDNIEVGNKLFLGLQQGIIKFNSLDNEAKSILEVFSNHLQVLYENNIEVNASKLTSAMEQLSLQEKIIYLSEKFNPNGKYDLPDRIVRSFCYQAGIKNFEQLKNIITNSIQQKDKINRARARLLEKGQIVKLEQGDFIRGIGEIDAFGSSLDNGNVCKELLISFKGSSDSDATPLDIDFSLITKDNDSIYNNIVNSPTRFNYGNIYIILKGDNPNIDITRGKEENLPANRKYDPRKIEMFKTKTTDLWGARTGIASSDIDYILYKRYNTAISSTMPYDEKGNVKYDKVEEKYDIHELSLLKMEIVKNGFYIPVIDFSGKIIFTPEEFDKLKSKMDGLSYYEIKSQWDPNNIGPKAYHMTEHTQNNLVESIKKSLFISEMQTKSQSEIISSSLANIIENINTPSGEKMKYKSGISGKLVSGTIEVISTGSTSRNTNVPGDYDFDYIFRIDTEIYKDPIKMENLRNQILSSLGIDEREKDKYILGGNIRKASLTLKDGTVVPLDITFVRKTDKVQYSTDMALEDRMMNISRNPEVANEVKANIILAKMLLKSAGCYKASKTDVLQGGLGGVGTENWILQNGGSLESAAESFLASAKEAKKIAGDDDQKEFLEFLRRYQVYDFGANHLTEIKDVYPYDEFVYTNMNLIGYKKMCNILEQYLKFVKGDKQVLEQPEFQKVLSELDKQAQSIQMIQSNIIANNLSEDFPSYSDKGRIGSRGKITFIFLMTICFILSIMTIIIGIVSFK